MVDYILVNTEQHYNVDAALFKEYAYQLNIDLGFQRFEEELQELKEMYNPKNGGIILCKNKGEYIACVAIRKTDTQTAELKRMFVKPAYQRQGIGKILLGKAVEMAKSCGYTCIRLDTLNYMAPAINLYKQNGFYETEAYYFNPNKTAVYFEKKI
jgi:ribosomal protein S18 acetylase RimI-like enzyme